MIRTQKPQHGFTLIELLVVIAIIAVLSSVVLSSLNAANAKGRDARREADIQQMQSALQLYYSDFGQYPNPATAGCTYASAWSSWGCWKSIIPTKYLPVTPTDPMNIDLGNCGAVANCHIYEYCTYNNYKNYVLGVNLENAPPRAYGSSPNCSMGGPNNYWVGN